VLHRSGTLLPLNFCIHAGRTHGAQIGHGNLDENCPAVWDAPILGRGCWLHTGAVDVGRARPRRLPATCTNNTSRNITKKRRSKEQKGSNQLHSSRQSHTDFYLLHQAHGRRRPAPPHTCKYWQLMLSPFRTAPSRNLSSEAAGRLFTPDISGSDAIQPQ